MNLNLRFIMKILIFEDDLIFGAKLEKKLIQFGFDVIWMTGCNNVDVIFEAKPNLLVLDLNLGESTKLHGEGILERIKNRIDIPIIVMTAYDERIVQLLEYNIFTVVRKPLDIMLLIHTIRKALSHHELAHSQKKSRRKADYAIVTAMFPDEFESVVRVFNLDISEGLKLGAKNVFAGRLNADPASRVVAIYQTDVGRTDSSSLVTDIIREFNPRYVFMTGVCGGNQSVNLGDVVVAKFVFTFDKGKVTDIGFLREIELVKTHEGSLRKIIERNKEVLSHVIAQLQIDEYAKATFDSFEFESLNSHIDPMACSSAVINRSNYFSEVIQAIERKATAVEMESYGFARACESTNHGESIGIIIKSVMDNTVSKDDNAKEYASYSSALYLKKLLELKVLE